MSTSFNSNDADDNSVIVKKEEEDIQIKGVLNKEGINDEKENENKNEKYDFDIWDELNCDTNLLRGIYGFGFEKPSIIQQKAILPIIRKRDVIAQSQSGTGKTGCFCVAILQLINLKENATQAIILAPTRELSQQIKNVLDNIGIYMKGLKTQLLIGGSSINNDVSLLNEQTKPHIIVGCPGRVYDMINRRRLSIKSIRVIVLDEADEMLSRGFKEQVYKIFKYLPNDSQIVLFSATLPKELNEITLSFMRDPYEILIQSEKLSLDGIKQYYVALQNENQKYDTLVDIFGIISMKHTIIYCNSVSSVSSLYEDMTRENYPVCQIHSNMTHQERTQNLKDFSTGVKRVLISSDITSRGIDIQQVRTVINYDIPNCVHNYLHRIGRSGRWGKKGISINFVTKSDIYKLRDIETHYKIKIEELPSSWDL
jgi:translation initiation factor 4A